MKILITGNLGYVGPGVIQHFRKVFPTAHLIGFDTAFFNVQFTNPILGAEHLLNEQHFGDVRNFPSALLNGVDAVVHLAAVSNDPMGNKFETPTLDTNFGSTKIIAEMAKAAGVSRFIFASSCSVYGFADDKPRTETSELNPLTAYAKSKVMSEEALKPLANDSFTVTCLRFATACGMSDRLRLDLVLNDFVAGAITAKQISILSDGTPWRPLINVKDMPLAMEWGIVREKNQGGNYVVVNAGSNIWNYQVKELAEAVAAELTGVSVSVNPNAAPDKRSYKVDFSLFEKLAPLHQPKYNLQQTIKDLVSGLQAIQFNDTDFRKGRFMRLNVLNALMDKHLINEQLIWNK
ncbi:MAG: hypothetical protein RL708_1004 [Bacteroidota bacterium]|jgi:nucleoside-diphosphate-sugar epimerase